MQRSFFPNGTLWLLLMWPLTFKFRLNTASACSLSVFLFLSLLLISIFHSFSISLFYPLFSLSLLLFLPSSFLFFSLSHTHALSACFYVSFSQNPSCWCLCVSINLVFVYREAEVPLVGRQESQDEQLLSLLPQLVFSQRMLFIPFTLLFSLVQPGATVFSLLRVPQRWVQYYWTERLRCIGWVPHSSVGHFSSTILSNSPK